MARKRQPIKCSARKPHFFKVLLGDFAHKLRIPPKFVKHISSEDSNRVILHSPNGSSWHVGLSKTAEGIFLSSGWPNFVEGHYLKEHEFLVFRYDGNMHFSVLMFDTTACEKDHVLSSKTHENVMVRKVRRKQGRLTKCSLDALCLWQTEIKNESQDLFIDDMCPPWNPPEERYVLSPKPDGYVNVKTEDASIPTAGLGSEFKCTKGYLSRRQPVTEQGRLKAQEAAYSFHSTLPFFISRMTPSSLYKSHTQTFPKGFSQANLPRRKTNLVLRDPSGKAWVVVYIPSQKDIISGGWSAFSRGNNLEEGDFCAFELIGPIELRIHIFRVKEHTKPLVKE